MLKKILLSFTFLFISLGYAFADLASDILDVENLLKIEQNKLEIAQDTLNAQITYSGALEDYNYALVNYSGSLELYSGALSDYNECFGFSFLGCTEEFEILINTSTELSTFSGSLNLKEQSLATAEQDLEINSSIALSNNIGTGGLVNQENIDNLNQYIDTLELELDYNKVLYYENLVNSGSLNDKIIGSDWLRMNITNITSRICLDDTDKCSYLTDVQNTYELGLLTDVAESKNILENEINKLEIAQNTLNAQIIYSGALVAYSGALVAYSGALNELQNAQIDYLSCIVFCSDKEDAYNKALILYTNASIDLNNAKLDLNSASLSLKIEQELAFENEIGIDGIVTQGDIENLNTNIILYESDFESLNILYNEDLIENGTNEEKIIGLSGIVDYKTNLREELCGIDENSDECKNALIDEIKYLFLEKDSKDVYNEDLIENGTSEEKIEGYLGLKDDAIQIREVLCGIDANSDECKNALSEEKIYTINYFQGLIENGTSEEKLEGYLGLKDDAIQIREKLCGIDENSYECIEAVNAENEIRNTYNDFLMEGKTLIEQNVLLEGLINNINALEEEACGRDKNSAICNEYKSFSLELDSKYNILTEELLILKEQEEREIKIAEAQIILDDENSTDAEKVAAAKVKYENSDEYIANQILLNEQSLINSQINVVENNIADKENEKDKLEGIYDQLLVLSQNYPDNSTLALNLETASGNLDEVLGELNILSGTLDDLNSTKDSIDVEVLGIILDEEKAYNEVLLSYGTDSEQLDSKSWLTDYYTDIVNSGTGPELIESTNWLATESALEAERLATESALEVERLATEEAQYIAQKKEEEEVLNAQIILINDKQDIIQTYIDSSQIIINDAEKVYKENCRNTLGKLYVKANKCFKDMCNDSKDAINYVKEYNIEAEVAIKTYPLDFTYDSTLSNDAKIKADAIDYTQCGGDSISSAPTSTYTGNTPVGTSKNTNLDGIQSTTVTNPDGSTTTTTTELESNSILPEVNCVGLPGCVDKDKANPTAASRTNNLGIKVISSIIGQIIQFVAVIAVIALILSGMMYLLSGGDEEKAKKAKAWITWALVGVLLSISAWGIIGVLNKITIG